MSWLKAKKAKAIAELMSDSDSRLGTIRVQIMELITEAALSGFTTIKYNFNYNISMTDIETLIKELAREGYSTEMSDSLDAIIISW